MAKKEEIRKRPKLAIDEPIREDARPMKPGDGAEQIAATKRESTPGGTKRPIRPGDGAAQVAETKAQMMRGTAPKPGVMSEVESMEGPRAPQKKKRTRAVIGEEEIRKADAELQKYKSGKAALDNRIIANDSWYKLRHWAEIVGTKTTTDKDAKRNTQDPEPTSGWLFNALANKHADAMDNYPSPTVLPREQADQQDAQLLTSVLPVVLEQNDFEQVYSDAWWYKLKNGAAIYGVFWDSSKLNGIGDINIRKVDILNLFWEPTVRDIQKSRNLFHVERVSREVLNERYPEHEGQFNGGSQQVAVYTTDDSKDDSGLVDVVDWYYVRMADGGKQVLHYCKYTCGVILYASENDPEYAERGFYDHGQYPFIVDVMFPLEDSPIGFGYVDVCKSPQLYIDKLDSVYIKHAMMAARQRYFVREDINVNRDDLNDWQKDFIPYTGSASPGDSILPLTVPDMDGNLLALKVQKIDEMKETAGNRDFSQGSTAAGVTAASAIAALQEAGSKLSRDCIKSSYRAFQRICYMAIDLMRQFYTEDRYFRITGDQGEQQFAVLPAGKLGMQQTGPESSRMPYFDIRVVAQKSSPFSTVAQNERAKEFFGMGFFRPDMADQALGCLSMMQFEGIEQIKQLISKNGTIYQAILQLGPLALAMAGQLDQMGVSGANPFLPQVAAILQRFMAINNQPGNGRGNTDAQTNALGATLNKAMSSTSGAARVDAATRSTPRA